LFVTARETIRKHISLDIIVNADNAHITLYNEMLASLYGLSHDRENDIIRTVHQSAYTRDWFAFIKRHYEHMRQNKLMSSSYNDCRSIWDRGP